MLHNLEYVLYNYRVYLFQCFQYPPTNKYTFSVVRVSYATEIDLQFYDILLEEF